MIQQFLRVSLNKVFYTQVTITMMLPHLPPPTLKLQPLVLAHLLTKKLQKNGRSA